MRHEGGQSPQLQRLREWGPVVLFSVLMLFMTGVVLGHLRDGSQSFFAPQEGFFNNLVSLPVRSMGLAATYGIGALMLGLAVWLVAQKPVAGASRRAIGLVLFALSLSCLMALVGETVKPEAARIWGGQFGLLLAKGFLFLGRPLAILVTLGLLGFALVVGQDWFFYNALRNSLLGSEPKPAPAGGSGRRQDTGHSLESAGHDADFIRPVTLKGSSMIGSNQMASASGVMTPMLDAARTKRPKTQSSSLDDTSIGAGAAVVEMPVPPARRSDTLPSPVVQETPIPATQASVVVDLDDLDLDGFDTGSETESEETIRARTSVERFTAAVDLAAAPMTVEEEVDPLTEEIDESDLATPIFDMGRGRKADDEDAGEEEAGGEEEGGETEFEEETEFEDEEVEFEEEGEDEEFEEEDEDADDEEEEEEDEDDDDVDEEEEEDDYADDDDDDGDYDMDDVDEDLFASKPAHSAPVVAPILAASLSVEADAAVESVGSDVENEPTVEEVFAAMAAEEEASTDDTLVLSAPIEIDESVDAEAIAALEAETSTTESADVDFADEDLLVFAPANEVEEVVEVAAEVEVAPEPTVIAGSIEGPEPVEAAEVVAEAGEVGAETVAESPARSGRGGDDWATWMDEPRPAGIAKPSERRRRAPKPVTSGQAGISGYFEQPNLFEAADEISSDTWVNAIKAVFRRDQCSVSLLQRELGITFATAAAVIDRMEREGLIGPYRGSGNREILVTQAEWDSRKV